MMGLVGFCGVHRVAEPSRKALLPREALWPREAALGLGEALAGLLRALVAPHGVATEGLMGLVAGDGLLGLRRVLKVKAPASGRHYHGWLPLPLASPRDPPRALG
eukprot:scaffold214328_cov47-Prasinocladus_malaysianus.AAC.1